MLEEREIFIDSYSITLLFKLPTVTPTKYISIYKCRYLSREDDYYKRQVKTINESVNYLRTLHLYPGSRCEITVVAVYHHGSLDPGLLYYVDTYLLR